MIKRINILAISGSTRASSSNLNLIKIIEELASDSILVTVFNELALLPQFNPDYDNEDVPESIKLFRQQINFADGVLICTPEYAGGVPGALKNAIDWTVSSMEFSQKPVALITAATSGKFSHESLLGTLLILETKITKEMQFIISYIKTKINKSGQILDKGVLEQINTLIKALVETVNNKSGAEQLFLKPRNFN
ncbi:MAG: NADPH-dependent FMN reductase [Pseudobdellovibrio sp.]